jgi:hypothetical protein
MVIRQRLTCAGAKGGVTLADRELSLAEMRRQVLFFFGAKNIYGWIYFIIFRSARIRQATPRFCANPFVGG